MEYIREANKNLISLRNSLITVVVVLTGGIVGLLLSETELLPKLFFVLPGIYLDVLFASNVISINGKIDKNVGVLKNECRWYFKHDCGDNIFCHGNLLQPQS